MYQVCIIPAEDHGLAYRAVAFVLPQKYFVFLGVREEGLKKKIENR